MLNIELNIEIDNNMIRLRGFLDGNSKTAIAEAFRQIPSTAVIVDAAPCTISQAGVETWIDVVNNLHEIEIIYQQSQLAMILFYDDHYRHQKSVFPDFYK